MGEGQGRDATDAGVRCEPVRHQEEMGDAFSPGRRQGNTGHGGAAAPVRRAPNERAGAGRGRDRPGRPGASPSRTPAPRRRWRSDPEISSRQFARDRELSRHSGACVSSPRRRPRCSIAAGRGCGSTASGACRLRISCAGSGYVGLRAHSGGVDHPFRVEADHRTRAVDRAGLRDGDDETAGHGSAPLLAARREWRWRHSTVIPG